MENNKKTICSEDAIEMAIDKVISKIRTITWEDSIDVAMASACQLLELLNETEIEYGTLIGKVIEDLIDARKDFGELIDKFEEYEMALEDLE